MDGLPYFNLMTSNLVHLFEEMKITSELFDYFLPLPPNGKYVHLTIFERSYFKLQTVVQGYASNI